MTTMRYHDRDSKAAYTAAKYAPILGGRVLDVGCDIKRLLEHLPPTASYTGVDMNPRADVVLNLDRDNLPFADRAFDTVLCTDTLEHIERIHAIFDELCRVAAAHVIVSLPNPYRNFLLQAQRGTLPKLRHYGLPTQPPVDRHRWFFGADDAARFIRERGELNGFEVEQLDVDEHGLEPLLTPQGVDVALPWNVRAGTTWAVLRRGASEH